jgi:hypothetical protein
MAFVVFKGERKIADLVERAYGSELTAAEKTRATAALERANPHLSKLKDVTPGVLVVVPRVPGLAAPPAAARAADPVSEGVREVAGALEDYRKELTQALKLEKPRVAEVKTLLGSQELRAVVTPESGGQERLDRIGAALADREAANERTETVIAGMAAVRDELNELADRLR